VITEIKEMRNSLNQAKGKRNLLLAQLKQAEENKASYETLYENCLKARAVVTAVAKSTQEQLEFHISNLVSMALSSVFGSNSWEFKLRFIERRNKTEADLIFMKNKNETDDILSSGGGGVADIASFALRVALWSIHKTRPVFILDEPFKFVSVGLQNKCSLMIKELSKNLKLQIIMVSHLPEIIHNADKIVKVISVQGESRIDENYN
jgi:DNA repair exonuclease SbcCD ATPase subunit